MIKKYKNTILLYILIVLIPTVFGSYYIIDSQNNNEMVDRIEHAKWSATVHQSYWDDFIRDTKTTLNLLCMTARTLYNDINKMEQLLKQAQNSDPRYGGIYLLDLNGKTIVGSNRYTLDEELFSQDLFQDVLETKDTIISNNPIVLQNEQTMISVAAPIIDENNNVLAISIALLRMDYIENIMKVLTPEAKILLLNAYNEKLLSINNHDVDRIKEDKWIIVPIEHVQWKVKVKIMESSKGPYSTDKLIVIGILLFLTHVLFLSILYLLLKRRTNREQRENEVQKLELVGALAASTAHEIRNPLTGIKGLVQLLSEKYTNQEDKVYFSIIHQEIERINEITGQFLILGKPTNQQFVAVDMREILQELLPIIETESILNTIQLNVEISEEKLPVLCTKQQMKQVILNITRNAFDALDKGGTITIQLKRKYHLCELIVIDSGEGIDNETITKIFTPFYTSKETGTGLGLVICKRILKSFKGDIFIQSKEKKGTTATVVLPLHKRG